MRSKIRKRALLIVPCLAGLLMLGCNAAQNNSTAGNTGTSSNSATMPTGIYTGTGSLTGNYTLNGATSNFSGAPYLMAFVPSSGNYMLLSYSTGSPNFISQIDTGTASVSNGSFTASDDQDEYLFSTYGGAPPDLLNYEGASLSATYVLNESITGTITYPGQDASLSFPLGMVGQSTQPASMSTIAGNYSGAFYSNDEVPGDDTLAATSTITITSAGALSGTVACAFGVSQTNDSPIPNASTSTPCTVSGTVTARSDIDAYNVSVSFANGTEGSFPALWVGVAATGMGYYDSANQKFMFGAVTAGNVPFAFSN